MDVLDIKEIGSFIRKKRKERGLRLEDLADAQISTATISNIERGVPHVNQEKVVYLLHKMKLDVNDIPALIHKDSEKMERIELTFTAIDTLIAMGKEERAFERLEEFAESTVSHYPATVHFLKGKVYARRSEWKRAERMLNEAIRTVNHDLYAKRMHIEGQSYALLAKCHYEQQEKEQALRYIEQGIASVSNESNGEKQLLYHLQLDRAFYLESLGHTSEAISQLNQLWKSVSAIQHPRMILQMYRLQASLYRRMKLYHDAINCVQQGIRLLANGDYEREHLALWLLSAQIFLEVKQFSHAETCLDVAQDMMNGGNRESIQVDLLYTQLYLLQQRTEEALHYIKRGVAAAEAGTDDVLLQKTHLLYAHVLRDRGDLKKAIKYGRDVLRSASASLRLYACRLLADCYHQLGDNQNLLEVSKMLVDLQGEECLPLFDLLDGSLPT